jgi:predicted aspartyl protease
MVDTGSEYTWVAGSTLREIGIRPEKKVRAVMANGSVLEREAGFALIMAGGFFTTDEVVFAQKGDLLLLGSRALAGLNVHLDAKHKRLVDAGPVPAASGSFLAVAA